MTMNPTTANVQNQPNSEVEGMDASATTSVTIVAGTPARNAPEVNLFGVPAQAGRAETPKNIT